MKIRYITKLKSLASGSRSIIENFHLGAPYITFEQIVRACQIADADDFISKLPHKYQTVLGEFGANISGGQRQRLAIARAIDAQIKALDTQIIAEATVAERAVASAEADLARNRREYQERQITTSSELLAAEASLEKAEADLQKAQADLSFSEVDRDRYEQLSQIGAIGRREFEQKKLLVVQAKAALESEEKAVDIAKAKVQAAKASVNPTTATMAIAKERIAQEIARGEASIATLKKEKQALIQRRVEMQNQLGQSQKELLQVITQLQDTILRASSNGIILKLNLRNPGQVLRVSEPIAEIAPINAALIIKAVVPTQEIKNVAVGQKVQLRIDACPYPDYGTLKGITTQRSKTPCKPFRLIGCQDRM